MPIHRTSAKNKRPVLTPAQSAELRSALEATRNRLLRACEEHRDQAEAAEAETGDVADVAEGVIEDRNRAALDELDRSLLEDVQHALKKVDLGTYGLSERSGRPIPFERLRVVPWARYDGDEAERMEKGPLAATERSAK